MTTPFTAAKRVPTHTYYWAVGHLNSVHMVAPFKVREMEDAYDDAKFADGNYYATREHAEKGAEKINAPYLAAQHMKWAEVQKRKDVEKTERIRLREEAKRIKEEEARRLREEKARIKAEQKRQSEALKRLVNLREAAQILGYSEATVYKWKPEPDFPKPCRNPFKNGYDRKWRLLAIVEWLKKHPKKRRKQKETI